MVPTLNRIQFTLPAVAIGLNSVGIASIAGMFLGALFNNAIGGMILLALISGIACIIHSLDNRNT